MPRSRPRTASLLAILALAPGCRTASMPSSSGAARRASEPTPRTAADVLERIEIKAPDISNALEAVVRYRPEFLAHRAAPPANERSEGSPIVYVNGVRQGGTEMLRSIPVSAVAEIRYLTAMAASAQFGSFHAGGVIAVRTRR